MTAAFSECTPIILVSRRRPGLPLASPPIWRACLVEWVLFEGALKGAVYFSKTEIELARESCCDVKRRTEYGTKM